MTEKIKKQRRDFRFEREAKALQKNLKNAKCNKKHVIN